MAAQCPYKVHPAYKNPAMRFNNMTSWTQKGKDKGKGKGKTREGKGKYAAEVTVDEYASEIDFGGSVFNVDEWGEEVMYNDWTNAQNVSVVERRSDEVHEIKNPAQEGWEKITVKVDSGAVENCIPKEVGKQFGIRSTPGSDAGAQLTAANGSPIT